MNYRELQIQAHNRKADKVWSYQENITVIMDYIRSLQMSTDTVLCHGVRNGKEMEYFLNAGASEVRGTEIADVHIPGVIVADFHDEISGLFRWANVVYSNSHDHSDRPKEFLKRCREQIRGNGVLVLEHSDGHEIDSDIEPWSATLDGLILQCINAGFELMKILDMPQRHGSYGYQVAAIFRGGGW